MNERRKAAERMSRSSVRRAMSIVIALIMAITAAMPLSVCANDGGIGPADAQPDSASEAIDMPLTTADDTAVDQTTDPVEGPAEGAAEEPAEEAAEPQDNTDLEPQLIDISGATVAGISNKTYTGKAITFNVKVSLAGTDLVKDTDYTVSYSNNTNVGTATVTITGKDGYTGTVTRQFKINSRTAKRFTLSGYDLTFKSNVLRDDRLGKGCYTNTLKATGYAKKVKLTWSSVTDKSGIDGYIIFRRDANGSRWRQIATVGRNTTSYTDKTAKTRNRLYRYTIVAYKKSGNNIKISNTAEWAGALTTKSSKKNVYSTSITNAAEMTVIMTGKSSRMKLSFPKKAYSKTARWYTSNKSIATVDSNGIVTGKAIGTVTITARLQSGRTISTNVQIIKGGTAQDMITVMASWVGFSTFNEKHKSIIDIYNAFKPLPVGYAVKYNDAWCDTAISAAAIRSGNEPLIGRECGVWRHVNIFKSKKIWIEDGTITPKPGDIIVYSWRKNKQPNNEEADHIALVESVKGNVITTIEPNWAYSVKRRTIKVGDGNIRGYARPKYKS